VGKKTWIEQKAKETVRQMDIEAKSISDGNYKENLLKHARNSESTRSIANMISSAKSEEKISTSLKQLDSNPMLFNCKNGTIDLETGEFYFHRRQDYITKISPVPYDPEADCPRFKEFLNSILNEQLVSYLQKIFGYTLTGKTTEQCYFILHGPGSNGKSTLLNVIRKILGEYTKNIDFDSLIKRNQGVRNDLARLVGARFVTSVEVENSKHINESVLNRLTGGDYLTVRFLQKEYFEYQPEFKLFIAGNHKPQVKGSTHATWRRIRLIPFEKIIQDNEKDPDLPSKLNNELPGILNWMIEGCLRWQEEGLGSPEEVTAANQEYREEMDVLSDYLKERCITDSSAKVKASELYKDYKQWCDDPLSKNEFRDALFERGFKRKKTGGHNQWFGISPCDTWKP
jgi:putative DNA primase/helicase